MQTEYAGHRRAEKKIRIYLILSNLHYLICLLNHSQYQDVKFNHIEWNLLPFQCDSLSTILKFPGSNAAA